MATQINKEQRNETGDFVFLFDLDGTITKRETLPEIAAELDIVSEIDVITKETVEGKIPFVESFIHRVNILKNYSVERINRIVASIELHPEIVEFICQNGERCAVVTGNLDCWVKSSLENLDCEAFTSLANFADDKVIKIERIINKSDVVADFQRMNKKVVFVGEGNNDAQAIRVADIGVAFGGVHWPSDSVMECATHAVFDEEELCRFLRQLL